MYSYFTLYIYNYHIGTKKKKRQIHSLKTASSAFLRRTCTDFLSQEGGLLVLVALLGCYQ